MVYETGNRTIDGAVERVMDKERPDRRDALAMLARPITDAVRAHFGNGTADVVREMRGHRSTAVLPPCECAGEAA
ncbi:hypothetical protein BDK88_3991 [Natrinema hispanicum]|uniref:Uncharacterized protein n=1 Tax=Natrinema hispanicum TaxID=392421 RepID=A0A482Y0V4_9EURY|nr:hypothetical protein BDK88_3991 [Natrinema hispanicum]